MRIAIFALILAFSCPLHAATLFKCTGSNGIPTYVSKEIPGASCVFVSTYTPDKSGRWRFVTVGLNNATVSYDSRTIVRTPGSVTVWVQFIYQGEKKYIPSKGYSEKTLSREKFSCEKMTNETLSYTEYDDKGAVIDGRTYPAGTIPSPIIPDTVYELVWQAVCATPKGETVTRGNPR